MPQILFGGIKIEKIVNSTWPASREKGPLDITHSVDPDQPLYDFETPKRNKVYLHS